jgi:hypothetical protein
VASLTASAQSASEPGSESASDLDDAARARHRQVLGDAVESLSALAAAEHVDLESLLRERVVALGDQIRGIEAQAPGRGEGAH